MSTSNIKTRCCIAGGGPAGMMLGFLLARAGIDVVVLEKHADFLRDFRGDTVHPSTLELMYELGLLQEFLQRSHQEIGELAVRIGEQVLSVGDFSGVSTHCKFIALMPQWDFLNFIAEHAKRYPAFHLMMQAEVTAVTRAGDKVTGVTVRTPEGELEVTADLLVAADGRGSTVRERMGFEVLDFGAPMDVLWLRLSKRPDEHTNVLGNLAPGRIFVTLDRGDYWQCAYVIPKGGIDEVRAAGLPAFQRSIAELAPFVADHVGEVTDWDQVKLLTVKVDRLRRWALPGVLCIGDAAHAMSPIGGVGINLAVQDAVAAANLLAGPLARGAPSLAKLDRVQQRREFPTRFIQAIQVTVQKRMVSRVLTSRNQAIAPPAVMRLLLAARWVRRLFAHVVGVGVRPEHIETPDSSR